MRKINRFIFGLLALGVAVLIWWSQTNYN